VIDEALRRHGRSDPLVDRLYHLENALAVADASRDGVAGAHRGGRLRRRLVDPYMTRPA
jgi:hypothetical protein